MIEQAEAAGAEEPDDSLVSRIFRTVGEAPSPLDDRGAQALFARSDYHWDPRDPSRYDLVINTSRLDIPTTIDIIVAASRRRAA